MVGASTVCYGRFCERKRSKSGMRLPTPIVPLLAVAASLLSTVVYADVLSVAVASNFSVAMEELVERYESRTGQAVRVSRASTGKLYAQVVNGAPFDVLLAADAERPALLEASGLAVAGSRFTYAVGRLVLWSRDPRLASSDCREALSASGGGRVAVANPDTAPYGAAAREALNALGFWQGIRGRLVIGESVGQTLHFVASGNAALGFIAAAQLKSPNLPATACQWAVPAALHSPIEQQAVLLRPAEGDTDALAFLRFLRGAEARRIIADNGYALPE